MTRRLPLDAQEPSKALPKWGGRRAQAWSAAVLARSGRVCALRLPGCTTVATTADHITPRSERPDLQYDVSNGRPACVHCNCSRGKGAGPAPVRVDERDWFSASRRPAP